MSESFRILLVEDDASDADFVRRTLRRERAGYELTHVGSLHEATEAASGRFDVVLLDLALPDARGLPLLAGVRRAFPDTPVLVLSGSGDETIAVEAVRQGAEDYLLKGEATLHTLARTLRHTIERRRARDDVAAARRDFEAFFDMSLDLLAIAKGTSMLRVNPAWTRALGWTSEQLLATRVSELVHPDDREVTLQEAAWVNEGRPRQAFRNRLRAADGSYRWLEWSLRPLPDGRVYCVARDVTEQQTAAASLRESEQRFRALAEGSIEGIVVERVQDDFRPLFVNLAAARMFGFASTRELMRLESLAGLAPPHSLAMARESWTLLATGQLASVQGRVEMRRRDGSPIWCELMGTVITWGEAPALQMTLVDVTDRARLEQELERQARTDALTGLFNRRHFVEAAGREMRRAVRHPLPLSVLVIDADHFKSVNDQHGHIVGDQVLRQLAGVMRRSLRDIDLLCRWGGEEFVAMLVGANAAQSSMIAERIRQGCAEAAADAPRVTVSIGVADCAAHEVDLEAVVARADRALYEAKASGRNRVKVAAAP